MKAYALSFYFRLIGREERTRKIKQSLYEKTRGETQSIRWLDRDAPMVRACFSTKKSLKTGEKIARNEVKTGYQVKFDLIFTVKAGFRPNSADFLERFSSKSGGATIKIFFGDTSLSGVRPDF